MDRFLEYEEKVTEFAQKIAEEISSRNFIDESEMIVFAKARLHIAIHDCSHLQSNDLELQKQGLVDIAYGQGHPAWKKREAMTQIQLLVPKIKKMNRLLNTINDRSKYDQLRNFVRSEMGKDDLERFYNDYLNKNGNEKRRPDIKKKRRPEFDAMAKSKFKTYLLGLYDKTSIINNVIQQKQIRELIIRFALKEDIQLEIN